MSRWSDIEIFVGVVAAGQFTGAAQSFGLSKSYVSKRVAELESRLGARLLNRTTRHLSLTAAGAAFYERCTALLDGLNEAEQEVADLHAGLRGSLRLTVPLSFGLRYVAPLAAELVQQHRELQIHVDYSDRIVNILDEGYDLALRVGGPLDDTSLVARRIAPVRLMLVASPAYLKTNRPPEHPRDLVHHDCLLYTRGPYPERWEFAGPLGRESVQVRGRMWCDNGDALVDAAVRGLGLTFEPDFIVGPFVHDGLLVELMPEWTIGREYWLRALFPHRRYLPAKVDAFLNELTRRYASAPWMVPLPEELRGQVASEIHEHKSATR